MGAVETPETNEQSQSEATPEVTAPVEAQSSLITALEQKVGQLEAKLKKLEEEAVTGAHNRISAVENFLKSKYPYSL